MPSSNHSKGQNKMSELTGNVTVTGGKAGHVGFHVEAYEKIEYDFAMVDGVFDIRNPNLAEYYQDLKRCLLITDLNVYSHYGKQMEAYFAHYGIALTIRKMQIGEKAKSIPTLLSMVDWMNEFGIFRKVSVLITSDMEILTRHQEPVLVVGGGLVTDIGG